MGATSAVYDNVDTFNLPDAFFVVVQNEKIKAPDSMVMTMRCFMIKGVASE